MTTHPPAVPPVEQRAWKLLLWLLAAESLGALWLAYATIAGFLGALDEPLMPIVSILIVGLAASAWVIITLVAALRGRGWARGSALTLHILLLGVAIGAFQGAFANPAAGWGLLIPAGLGIYAAVQSRPGDRQAERREP